MTWVTAERGWPARAVPGQLEPRPFVRPAPGHAALALALGHKDREREAVHS